MREYEQPPSDQLFLEGVELYDEIGSQLVAKIVSSVHDQHKPLELSEETLESMSPAEIFKYQAAELYNEAKLFGPDIDKEVVYHEDKFNDFRDLFTILYPDNPLSALLQQDAPISAILESGDIDKLMEMAHGLNLYNQEDIDALQEALEYVYLSETGAVDELRQIPESERKRLADTRNVKEFFSSPSVLKGKIDALVSDEVFDDLISSGDLSQNQPYPEIKVDYLPNTPKQSRLHLVYKAAPRGQESQTLQPNTITRETFSVRAGKLLVSRPGPVAEAGERIFINVDPEKPLPASPGTEKFILKALHRAVIKLTRLSHMSTEELRRALYS